MYRLGGSARGGHWIPTVVMASAPHTKMFFLYTSTTTSVCVCVCVHEGLHTAEGERRTMEKKKKGKKRIIRNIKIWCGRTQPPALLNKHNWIRIFRGSWCWKTYRNQQRWGQCGPGWRWKISTRNVTETRQTTSSLLPFLLLFGCCF